MSRKAIIDIGSNSIKFFVGELAADKTITTVLDTNDIARLGENLNKTGMICPEAMERNVASVANFCAKAKELGADEIVAVGTMALRTASNSAEFVEKVKAACGLEVQIIPGEEEARLSYLAVLSGLPLQGGDLVVFDTGGGSTEFIFGHGTQLVKRFTFNVNRLYDGIKMVPVLICLFALGEVLSNLEHYDPNAQEHKTEGSYKLPKLSYYWKLKWPIIRSGIVGCLIGIFPSAGGTIASFLAYDVEKRCSKHPEEFGHGALEGVCAAEASNSGSVGGAMVPMLTLGIPGSSTAAVLMSALMIHNLTPGPQLFTDQPALVYGLFASMFVANALMALVGTYGSKIWVRVGDLPKTLLYPLIFAFSILGSYSISKSLFDVGTCLVFGLIGWMFKKYDYPASPVVLGLVLGRLMELNFRQALMVSGISSFVTRPMTVILFIISIAAIVYPILAEKKAANKRTAAN